MGTFKLGSPFEIWGHWWLPDKPKHRLVGKLSSRGGNLQLKLLGNFESIDLNARNLIVPVILGVGDAKELTIWRAVQETPSFKFPGSVEQTFRRMRVLVGGHFDHESSTRFSEVSFGAAQIGPWLANNPVAFRMDAEGNCIRSLRHEVNTEERNRNFGPTRNGLTYRFGCGVSTSHKPYVSYSFELSPSAHITFKEPVSCADAIGRVERTTELLTLLVGEYVEHQSIQLYIPGEKSGFDFLYEHRPPKDSNLIEVHDVLAPLPSLSCSLEAILDKWDEQYSKMSDSVNLLRDVLDRDRPASHVQIILLSQSLEAFHRNVCSDSNTYIPKAEFKSIRREVEEAIPDRVPKELRGSMVARLSYANEITLRTRLEKLLDALSEDSLSLIEIDKASFARDVAKARNGYTHWDQNRQDDRHVGADLANLLSELLAITQIVLLHHLGISDDLVVAKMKRAPFRFLRRYQPLTQSE